MILSSDSFFKHLKRPTMGSPDVEVLLRQHSRLTDLTSKTNDVQFARMMLDIPTADQADNFTVGTLGTKNGFGDGPAVASSISEKTMIAVYYLGAAFTGHKGYVHGGALATLLDESCGRAALCHFQGQKDNGEFTLPDGSHNQGSDDVLQALQQQVLR